MSLGTSVLKCLSNLNLLLLQNFVFSKKCNSRGSAPSNDIFSNKEVAVTAFPVDPTFRCFMQLRHAEGQASLSDNAQAIAGLKGCNASLQSLVTMTLQIERGYHASKLHLSLYRMDFFLPFGVVSSFNTA